MRFRFCLALVLLLALARWNLLADENLFRDRVAPVFASHCFDCHNRREAKGDFSLEDAPSFFDAGFVEPGDAANSYLIHQVTTDDDRQRPAMPKNGPILTPQQVDAIREWIDTGAKWPDGMVIQPNRKIDFDWWSLKKLQRPVVPKFDDDQANDWIRTPVDAFVLRKLRENGLTPSPPADRPALIRRLFYDVTGLPPTVQEMQAFASDTRVDAYDRWVDRLLSSPRYGEHWARHWLDVVRYADTCGYDKDKLRSNAWPYRDYVIRSLNEDKPYRQFVQQQIAGDELYPNSPDGILGLGFIAAGPWDFIGHVEVPESKIDGLVARNLDRDDMVSNTLNTFCSVTIQCARCHDHKFDPFSQQHYYGLQAVFAAVDRADRVYDVDSEIEAKRKSLGQQIRQLSEQIDEIGATIAAAGGEELKAIDEAIQQAAVTSKRPEFGYHSEIAAFAEVEKWVEVELAGSKRVTQIILRPCHDDFANIGAGFGFPVRFRIEVDGRVVLDQANEDLANPKLQPVSISVSESATRIRVVATKLAPRNKDFIFALAELQILDDSGTNIAIGAKVNALDSIEMPVRWQASNLVDGIWFESGDNAMADLENQRAALIDRLIGKEMVEQQTRLNETLSSAKSELERLPPGKMVYAAATEFPAEGSFKPTHGKPRSIRLLNRGDVEFPGETVEPGVLPLSENDSWTLDLDKNATDGQRRAALARWLTRDNNPLTWRSIVNRVWHYHFGAGLWILPMILAAWDRCQRTKNCWIGWPLTSVMEVDR